VGEGLLERLPARFTTRRQAAPTGEGGDATVDDNRVAVGLALGGLVAWIIATRSLDPRRYTDLGLVAAAGPWFWLALVLAVAGFVFAIRARRFRWPVALLTLGVVILILYATPSVVEGTARVEASYRHLGVSDHIARPCRISHHSSYRVHRLAEVWQIAVKPAPTGLGVRNDTGERLIQLVGQRDDELAHGSEPRHMRKLCVRLTESFIDLAALFHIRVRSEPLNYLAVVVVETTRP